jgi:HTH-type transcriptional repressor of NAD biosynthesis genes
MGPRDITPEDFERIAIGQLEREEMAARTSNGLLFCDTDVITTEAFAEVTLGTPPARVSELAEANRHALYLLLDIDAPWVDDGTRWYPERRAEHMAVIKRALERRGREYVLVQGDYDERFRSAVAKVESHLARRTAASFGGAVASSGDE